MRRLKKIIYTILIVLLISIIYWKAYPVLDEWLMEAEKDGRNPLGTTVQLTYMLKTDNWTTFPVDSSIKYLKFVTNAEYYKTHSDLIYYAMEVEILNISKKVLLNRVFYFKNETELYREKKSSRILSNPFIIKGKCYITPNQSFILPLDNLNKPTTLKVKMHQIKNINNVKAILVRVSSEAPVSGPKKSILWYRLSPESKENLASSNFYPSYMLTKTEKQNLLSHMWSPIGPQGTDYKVRRIGKMPSDRLTKIKLLVNDDPNIENSENAETEMFKLYVDSGRNGLFKPQKAANIKKAKKLFVELFNGTASEKLKDEWNNMGMSIKELQRGKRTYTIIYEDKDKLWGRGFFMFCKSKIARNIVLEMPHRFWDTYTGIIGYKLMLSGYFTAATWNTVHRYQTANDLSTSSDMAHAENSYFYSFTQAFTVAMPKNSTLIQLHGFSNKNQKSIIGKKASAVISNSTSKPIKRFYYYAEKIKEIMPKQAYIYPVANIKWLAALSNVSAKVIKKAKRGQLFIHVEMNDKTRSEMAKDFELRDKFTKSIKSKIKKHYPVEDK